MSDYTPTTGHILEAFAWDERYDGLDTERMKQFDRWLAEVILEAKAEAWDERESAEEEAVYDTKSNRVSFVSPRNPYRQGETE